MVIFEVSINPKSPFSQALSLLRCCKYSFVAIMLKNSTFQLVKRRYRDSPFGWQGQGVFLTFNGLQEGLVCACQDC